MEPQHQPPERRPTVPPGFHFTPSPEELIHSYLNPWITGQPLDELEGIVCSADVYSRDPATLTKKFKNFCYDGHWYFFCVSKWKEGKTGGRVSRCVDGGGTWHNTFKRKPVGEHGCCRMAFEYRDAGDKKTGWLMEEFASNLEEATDVTGVKVICKVYLSRRARALAPDEEEPQATKVIGSKRPALHREHGFREAAASNVAPSPAETGGAAVVGCSNAGTSQAAPMAWLQPMLESMSKPVYYCGYGGVDIKREPELPIPMPLAMASANGEVLQFAQTDGLGAVVDVKREDVSPDEWLDRILSFNDGAGDADDLTGVTATR